jgi:hypothetical protein
MGLGSGQVLAGDLPRLGVGCAGFNVPAGTAGVAFSRDCKTAFVLPPTVGSFTIQNLAVGGNLGLCPAFNLVKGGIENELAKLVGNQVSQQNGTSLAASQRCMSYYQAKKFLQISRPGWESQITSSQNSEDAIDRKQPDCASGKLDKNTCDLLPFQKATLAIQISDLQAKVATADDKLGHLEAALSTCGDMEKAIANLNTVKSRQSSQPAIYDLSDQILALYKSREQIEGATLSVLMVADQNALVARAASANPSFNVQGVPTTMALALSSRSPTSSIVFPAALRVVVPSVAVPNDIFSVPENATPLTIFGPSASGNVVLSLPSSCAANITPTSPPPEVRPYFEVNAVYRFPVEVGTKITVTADYNELYKRIVKTTSNNGLFRTSTSNEITDFTKSDDVVTVNFDTSENISLETRERLPAS